MYRCSKCNGNMKFVYTSNGGYWICSCCGYSPRYEVVNSTKFNRDVDYYNWENETLNG